MTASAESARRPLQVLAANPRYFTADGRHAVLLVGSHVWNNLVDMGTTDPPPAFDWDGYLDFLQRHEHNFIRLWRWELTQWDTSANRLGRTDHHTVAPHPWLRTGPGKALDGKPKFDLGQLNPEYFDRLRRRVVSAGERGIYVSVMLFEGWGVQRIAGGFKAHPFHRDNNINGIDGDVNADGRGLEIHTMAQPAITRLQETYVRRVIDTVNDLDNVLYEISNENHPPSTEWQYHMIRFIHEYEAKKANQHPVGMTFQFQGGSNQTLFDSPAEWISPNPQGGYRNNPPAADGSKVIISDTDHLWGIGGNAEWVWKSFLRGLNPIFMDPYDGVVLGERFDPKFEPIRRCMGYARRLAARCDLARLTPKPGLASTRYCLANIGAEYLVYQPQAGKPFTVRLAPGMYQTEWMNADTGELQAGAAIDAGQQPVSCRSPFAAPSALHLTQRRPP